MAVAERTTISKVAGVLDDHLVKHQDVYDPRSENMRKVLFGADGDDGMCLDVKEIKKGFNTLRNLGYALLTATLVDIVSRLLALPKM